MVKLWWPRGWDGVESYGKKRQILKNAVNLQQKVNNKLEFVTMRKISSKVNSRSMEDLQNWQGRKQIFLRYVQIKKIMHGFFA